MLTLTQESCGNYLRRFVGEINEHRSVQRIYFFLIILGFGCSKPSDEDVPCKRHQYDGNIDKIQCSDSLPFGSSDTVSVFFWGGTSGCAKPIGLSHFEKDNVITFKASYSFPDSHCEIICTTNVPYHQLNAIINPERKGKYILQNTENEVLATLLVY